MSTQRILSAFVLAGCGGPRAHTDAAHDVVVVDALPTCDVTKPFGPPVLVSGINTSGAERSGWLSTDALTIWFAAASIGASDRNLFVATRASVAESFSNVMPLVGVNTSMYDEDHPSFTDDGLEMFLQAGGLEVHHSIRTSTAEAFGAHTAVVNDSGVDRYPWITGDGLTLYFSSNRTGNPDLYRVTRPDRATPFSVPEAVSELNTSTDEIAPVVSSDGLEIFFGKYLGVGDIGVYRAIRAVPTDSFGPPIPVPELGVDGENFPSWIAPNRCTLLYTRANGFLWDVWAATRT